MSFGKVNAGYELMFEGWSVLIFSLGLRNRYFITCFSNIKDFIELATR